MVRILQAVSVLALIPAGVILMLCAEQWLQDTPGASNIGNFPLQKSSD